MLTRAHLGGIQLKNRFRCRVEMVSRDQYSLPCNHKRHKELHTATPDESIYMLEDFRRLQQDSVVKTHFICLKREGSLLLSSNHLNVSLTRTLFRNQKHSSTLLFPPVISHQIMFLNIRLYLILK